MQLNECKSFCAGKGSRVQQASLSKKQKKTAGQKNDQPRENIR
jgi:hypothetical protein